MLSLPEKVTNATSVAEHRPETYARDITLRYPVKCALGGNSVPSEKISSPAPSVMLSLPEKVTNAASFKLISLSETAGAMLKSVLPLDTTRTTNTFYFLTGIDVLTDDNSRSVICYGDSITSQAWPDYVRLWVSRTSV